MAARPAREVGESFLEPRLGACPQSRARVGPVRGGAASRCEVVPECSGVGRATKGSDRTKGFPFVLRVDLDAEPWREVQVDRF